MNYSKMKARTIEALRDPRPGDRFHEMYSFWVYVVAVYDRLVLTCEASPPCTLPNDGKWRLLTRANFIKRFCYGKIEDEPWVLLCDRDNDVEGWLEEAARERPERP